MPTPNVRSRGFTLIELMVAVAIVAILAAIAIPGYTAYVVRANRSAAQAEMMAIANRQQQYLLSSRSYATKEQLEDAGYSLPRQVGAKYSYAISLGSGSVPSFTITFTPIGSQASDGVLKLDSEGTKTPAGKW